MGAEADGQPEDQGEIRRAPEQQYGPDDAEGGAIPPAEHHDQGTYKQDGMDSHGGIVEEKGQEAFKDHTLRNHRDTSLSDQSAVFKYHSVNFLTFLLLFS